MRPGLILPVVLSCALLATAGCGSTTGGARIEFPAAAAGPEDADGGPLAFDSALGYRVTLTRARLHIGGLYLNQSVPTSGSQATECTLPGIYVAQVLGAVDLDLLSPALQPFPVNGEGTTLPATAGEVWLTGGAIDAVDDATVILDSAGSATRGAESYPFEARLTISQNRLIPTSDPAAPGANPICKRRIVSPIPVALQPRAGRTLVLRVDPRGLFASVDFAEVPKVADAPPLYRFSDRPDNPADINLFAGLRARTGVYTFIWP